MAFLAQNKEYVGFFEASGKTSRLANLGHSILKRKRGSCETVKCMNCERLWFLSVAALPASQHPLEVDVRVGTVIVCVSKFSEVPINVR